MLVLAIALAPLFLGFVLIAVIVGIARRAPRKSPIPWERIADDSPPHPRRRVSRHHPRAPSQARARSGVRPQRPHGRRRYGDSGDSGDEILELICRDNRPLAGGRLLIRASSVFDRGEIELDELRGFADGVRSDMGTSKGIFFAAAGFTDEARSAMRSYPAQVELVDPSRLATLVRERLPARSARLESFRYFTNVADDSVPMQLSAPR